MNSVENTINIVGNFSRIIVNNSCKTNNLFVDIFCKLITLFVLKITSIFDNFVAVDPRDGYEVVGRDKGVAQCKIDTWRAYGGHGVGSVADQQQARFVPGVASAHDDV